MKTIIAGGRTVTKPILLLEAVNIAGFTITEVVCGKACGADTLGEEWAKERNIPITYFPADWEKYGKSAGFIRNAQMADHAEALIALWDGSSKGTGNMIELAKKKGLKIYIHYI
jgi:hypothetical protein